MVDYNEEKQIYTIWRFMIDARYQGKGYGKAALRLSIDHLRKEFGAKEIYLYYEPDKMIFRQPVSHVRR